MSCNNVTDAGLKLLKSGCTTLQELDLFMCPSVRSHGIIALTETSVQLQQLNRSYCKLISSMLFSSLQKLKTLQVIKLNGCALDEADLSLIGRGCRELQELGLSNCQGVTDVGVVGVVTALTDLPKLDLRCCRDITDVALETVATNCSSLLSFVYGKLSLSYS